MLLDLLIKLLLLDVIYFYGNTCKNLHITIRTIGNGRPVDSNKIVNWCGLIPITVKAILDKHYLN